MYVMYLIFTQFLGTVQFSHLAFRSWHLNRTASQFMCQVSYELKLIRLCATYF